MATEAASETLKQQFLLLQEQQQQKLLRRKQRKEEKEKSSLTSRTSTRTSTTFGIDDNLDLKLTDPAPTSSFISEELVNHLNDQIRELKDENARVYKLLSEKDFEVRQIKKKNENQARVAGAVTNETAATKIVELSKKIRDLNADLESERTKARQYGKKCMDLQTQLNKVPEDTRSMIASATSRTMLDDKQDENVDVKSLQDKLKYAENKMADYRNQTSLLKQELKMAHKVLSQEVGENVNIQSILNNQSSWKGRAQQIMMLQKKVDELKAEIGTKKPQKEKEYDLEAEMLGTGNSSARQRTAIEKHREQLRKIEKERKESQEKATNEFKALEEEHAALKKKFDAARTRNSVLANQNKGFKEQMKTLMDKGHHDDELIEALMKQQSHLQHLLEQTTTQQKETSQKSQHEIKQMSMKTQQDNNVVEQLKAIVAEKEAKVHRLEDEIQQLKLNHLQRAQLDSANMLFQPASQRPPSAAQTTQRDSRPASSAQPVQQDYRPGTAESGDIQLDFQLDSNTPSASRMSDQPPVITSAMDRCPSVSSTVDTARAPPRKTDNNTEEATRGASRRGAIRTPSFHVNNIDKQAMTELQAQCQEYKTMFQVAQVERDKLSELVQLLQNRNEEASQKYVECQNELVQQRRKNAMLEKQVGKNKIEQTGSKGGTSGVGKKRTGGVRTSSTTNVSVSASFSAGLTNEENEYEDYEEIKTNLEIQRDENEALKAALQSTLKAKEEDLRMFGEMMDETKHVFLQALRQYKQNAQGS
ncbi:coiled-coil domain-containing protein 13-like isoform X1 [Ostrea edulis]|uniref:coiled-coil domain-containing protein 13-like isoform X1 n=1 Tax=Ostrea edulis TaxID=37623 RepID=UPI0024AFC694|nr:coiled-coil domain-containing protein 13-like isoform X1 [Ostrea edulis]XP_048728820.2 coiled-coil domain-containing protein 13-like isoform X1 [Ostrea edulis]